MHTIIEIKRKHDIGIVERKYAIDIHDKLDLERALGVEPQGIVLRHNDEVIGEVGYGGYCDIPWLKSSNTFRESTYIYLNNTKYIKDLLKLNK